MTREEAIKELKEDKMLYETDLCHAGDGSPEGQLLEALDMAIEALKDRPQGEWIYTMNPLRLNDEWECNKCGYLSFTKANYCGHCGCRMKGADDDR